MFLASKVDESPRRIKDVVISYYTVRKKFNMPIPADSVSYTPLNSNITDKSFATFPDIKFPESLYEEVLYIINMFIIQF